MAVAGLLALPLQAQAQSEILVSNVGQVNSSGSISLHHFDQAQAFTTGSYIAGYTLKSVEIHMGTPDENATAFTVSVHSSSSGAPGANLGTLSNPASLSSDGVHTFTTRGIALAAATTYFVVVDRVGAISGPQLYLYNTDSDAQDPGRASGWLIGNGSLYRDWDSSGTWTPLTESMKIRVKGYNPRVSNADIEIADASAAENAGHLLFEVTLSRALQKTVKVDFETISGGTATEGEDYHARRTYTHVILAGDRTAQMGFALIEDAVNDAGETVKARLSNARVVDAYGNVVSFLDITRDEATGTITAPPATTTNVPGLTIGIQDATGDEDSGWLDFKVKLSRKSDDLVCYDFETISGGTATEGRDYLKFPKATYWMQIGKRVDTPFVRIIDDSVNDNGETVKVKISNAHLCGDASRTLSITRAEATGTIRNTDPIMIADYPVGKIAEYPADKDGEAFSATPRDAANASFAQPSAAADVAVTDTGGETTPVTDTGGGTTPVTDTGGGTTPVTDTGGETTPVTDTGGGTTPVTPPAAVPAPTGLEATEGADGIVLNWSAPAATTDTVDGYIVNRCEGAGCIPEYYYWVPSGTTYTDRAVMANTLYRYSVSAHFSSSDKTSDWSNVIERTMGIVEAGLNYRDQVQIMYAAYYGRPGDAGGLDFWAAELEKVNGNLSRIINSFGNSEEFQDRFGDLDSEELVNNSYLQLLGRDADSGGLNFYVNGLREGRFTLASIALNVANGTQNLDEMIKANKLRAANAFTEASVEAGAAYGEFQIDDAKLWLAGVDSTSASITAALDSLPDLLEIFPEAMPPVPAEPVL